MSLKIALGSDHAGYLLKEQIKQYLAELGHEAVDYGTASEASVHYPIYVQYAAKAVSHGLCDLGIVFGGSGNGEAIAANKVSGVRCALCWTEETGRLAKEHNNANVISFGGRVVSVEVAKKAVKAWLEADFEGGRHGIRINMLEEDLDPPAGFDRF
ncbi:MAG: ribose 5-phosphate isomerase B [Bacteroidota bacterium]